MAVPSTRNWQDLTTEEVAKLDKAGLVVVVPVAATEQHGPHLPLSTDADIAEAVLDAAFDRLDGDLPVYRLPAMPFGLSPEHADFPGTITLRAETLIAVLEEIGASLAASGVRKVALFNTHGGQPQVLDIVAQRLRARYGLLALTLNGYRYWNAREFFPESEAAYGIHAGAAETSILLHHGPDKVRPDRFARFESLAERLAAETQHLRPYGREVGFGWQGEDLNPSGAVGDPTLATAEIGARLIAQAGEKLAAILAEASAARPDWLPGAGG